MLHSGGKTPPATVRPRARSRFGDIGACVGRSDPGRRPDTGPSIDKWRAFNFDIGMLRLLLQPAQYLGCINGGQRMSECDDTEPGSRQIGSGQLTPGEKCIQAVAPAGNPLRTRR